MRILLAQSQPVIEGRLEATALFVGMLEPIQLGVGQYHYLRK